MPAQAFYMPSPDGERFCVYHRPQGAVVRGRVLYIHPMAEEMNLSRRMAALQSRALAAVGYAVLQVDLRGCGDSSGEFGEALWDDWVADVLRACAWLRTHCEGEACYRPLWLWGLRAGCLLGQQAARHLDEACNLLLWQPPWSGKAVLQQLLRLEQAARMLGGATDPDSALGLRERLEQGQTVALGGYQLSAALSQGLQDAVLTPPAGSLPAQRVEWFELSSLQPPRISALPEPEGAQWRKPGIQLVRHALAGPTFWQSGNADVAPELLNATTAALVSALA